MTAETDHTPVRVDVVSDVICPWCFLGKRRLDAALEALPEGSVAVQYRPFLLDPSIPPEGMDRAEYIAQKFSDPEAARRGSMALKEYGLAEGIRFEFDKITRTPNTVDAHRLILWALSPGVQPFVVDRLFQLYFLEGADISERSVILQIAQEAGMDVGLVTDLFDKGTDKDRVMRDVGLAYRLGVTGVPTFILNGRYGLVGAQDTDVLIDAVTRLAAGEELQPQLDESES